MSSKNAKLKSKSNRGPVLLSWARAILVTAFVVAVGVAISTRSWHQPVSAQEPQVAELAAAASSGDLDLTFGVDGTVVTDLGNQLVDSACAVTVQPDGKVVAVGYVTTNSNDRDFAVIRLNTNGTPDTSFSGDGRHSFNFNTGNRDDIARAVAVQPDGKILIAGEADVTGFGNFDIVLARLNPDGTFDTGFGSGGKVSTDLPNNRVDFGRALVLQPDGKILVAGYSNRPTTGDDFLVIRYDASGALDTTFDGDGIVTTDILTNREDRAAAMVLQPDGRVVVAGYTNDPSFRNNFAVVRYQVDGSLDASLDGTGKVTTDLNLNSNDFANAVALQSDGDIVVAGQSAADFGLVRYNSSGFLDSSFGGGDGIVTTNFGTGAVDIGRAVVIQSSGKITVAGRSRSELALARYQSNGTLDNSFGRDGLLVQNAGNNFISGFGGYWGMALQADGKIVAAGDGWRQDFRNDFAVSRLNSNGTFDLSFGGGDGIAATDVRGRFDEARSVAVQPDGKIVVAGTAQNPTGGTDFAVARYNPNGSLDTSFDGDGIVTTDIQGHPHENGFAVAVQADGKIIVAGKTDNAGDGNLDDGALIRYNPNGSLDATFGVGGIVITTGGTIAFPSGAATWLYIRDIEVRPDGKIVVAGQAHYFSIHADGFVAFYGSNGAFEGKTLIDFSTEDDVNALALQPDGKIVVAGSVGAGPGSDFALARLNSNGVLDASFDGDGKVFTNFDNGHFDAAYDLALQPDGKLVVVGETVSSGTGSDMGVARYNPNGSLDTSFGGGDGMANIDFFNFRDYCSGVAIQPDGKIVLAGLADAQVETGWGVVKLNPNGTFDTTFGGGSGKVRTLFGDAVGPALNPAPFDAALQADGKIIVVGRINFHSTESDFTVVRYENHELVCTYTLNPTGANAAAAGGGGSFGVSTTAGCAWTAQSNAPWVTTGSSGVGPGTVFFSVAANTSTAPRSTTISVGGRTFTVSQRGVSRLFCSSPTLNVGESAGSASVVVTRDGDTSASASVDYATTNVTASDQRDYLPSLGTLRFAPGETTKTVTVHLTDDTYAEGQETFRLALSNPSGGTLGTPNATTVTIQNNEATSTPSRIRVTSFDAAYFVRQQYTDFFNRQPDAPGLAFWAGQFTQCGTNRECIARKRVDVSGAFFVSTEFQKTGYFVYLVHQAAFNSGERLALRTFLPDTQEVGRGVIGGAPNEQQLLEANRATFINAFVLRPEFLARYPATLTPEQFVDGLNANTYDPRNPSGPRALSQAERDRLVGELRSGVKTRAQVLRAVAENAVFSQRQFNKAFVLMQYFGYLRRNPPDPPELRLNFEGYNFWLKKMNDFNGDFRAAQMVQAFLDSQEYELRFGP